MITDGLAIRNLSKSYHQGGDTIHVIRGIDLAIKRGESLAIIGTSGSGKSTLLSLMAGLARPDQGTIYIGGHDITAMNEKNLIPWRGKNLGIVYQDFHLLPYLSAIDNVSLPLDLAGDKDAYARSEAALASVGLSHRKTHLPSELSGGECQRVAIARAFVTEPEIILADEPSGNLDEATGDKVMNLFFNLAHDKNRTLVLVTHNLALAQKCDRIVKLEEGRLASVGTVQ
jgi:putative ABC transport system ATP-binding protein